MNTNEIFTNIIIIHVCSEYLAAIMATSPNRSPCSEVAKRTFAHFCGMSMLYMPLRQGSSRCFSLDPYKYHKFSLRRLVSACWRGTTLRIHRILRYPGRDLDHQLLNCWTLTQNVAMNCNTQIFCPASYSMFPVGAVLGVQASSNINQKLMGSHGAKFLCMGCMVTWWCKEKMLFKICPNWKQLDHGLTDPDLWLKDVEIVGGVVAR